MNRTWNSFFTISVLLFTISSCVSLPELKLAGELEQKGQITKAYRQYEAALKKDPNNIKAREGLQRLRKIICNDAITEARKVIGSEKLSTIPLLMKALETLQQASPYDPEGKLLSGEETRYKNLLSQIDANNQVYAQEVRTAINEKQFQIVPPRIQRIRDTDPQSQMAKVLEKEYNTAYGDHLEQRILELLNDGNMSESRELMAEWDKLELPIERKTLFKKEVSTLTKYRTIQIARKLIDNRQYYKAYLKIRSSGYSSELNNLMAEIKIRGGRFYLDQARRRLDIGDVSRAYLEAVKGYEMDTNLAGMFEIYRDTRDVIFDRMQKYLAIPAFGAPRDDPDLGSQFSDALISYLFRMLPYGLNIVERERIDLLLEEQKRELKTVANLLNVDLIISGNVSLLNIDRQNTENLVTVKAKVGDQTIINPEFEVWQRLPQPKRDSAPPPPNVILMPVYQNFTYKKGRTTVKGYASVSLRVFDTSRGAITYAQEFNAKFLASDDYQDEVQMAGVKSDPQELPSDTEVREKLRNEIISQIAQVIDKHFEKREKKFLEDAQYYLSRRELTRALDMLAQGFLYCVKAKVAPSDNDFAAIRDNIIQLTEVGFLD
jgi:hypothetical protein